VAPLRQQQTRCLSWVHRHGKRRRCPCRQILGTLDDQSTAHMAMVPGIRHSGCRLPPMTGRLTLIDDSWPLALAQRRHRVDEGLDVANGKGAHDTRCCTASSMLFRSGHSRVEAAPPHGRAAAAWVRFRA
jgi:hypothetical protein